MSEEPSEEKDKKAKQEPALFLSNLHKIAWVVAFTIIIYLVKEDSNKESLLTGQELSREINKETHLETLRRLDEVLQNHQKFKEELEKSLKEVSLELETLQVEFIALTALRINEVQYFSTRLRNVELLLVQQGHHIPGIDREGSIDKLKYEESLQELAEALDKHYKSNVE